MVHIDNHYEVSIRGGTTLYRSSTVPFDELQVFGACEYST
jgi:hypothetical protein